MPASINRQSAIGNRQHLRSGRASRTSAGAVKLVLTLIELIRQLLERQALRRMENATLTAEETEAIGTALMRLEETIRDIGAQFDLSPEDLNLDLGPIGRLL
jgi:Gas vesicle protein K